MTTFSLTKKRINVLVEKCLPYICNLDHPHCQNLWYCTTYPIQNYSLSSRLDILCPSFYLFWPHVFWVGSRFQKTWGSPCCRREKRKAGGWSAGGWKSLQPIVRPVPIALLKKLDISFSRIGHPVFKLADLLTITPGKGWRIAGSAFL